MTLKLCEPFSCLVRDGFDNSFSPGAKSALNCRPLSEKVIALFYVINNNYFVKEKKQSFEINCVQLSNIIDVQ